MARAADLIPGGKLAFDDPMRPEPRVRLDGVDLGPEGPVTPQERVLQYEFAKRRARALRYGWRPIAVAIPFSVAMFQAKRLDIPEDDAVHLGIFGFVLLAAGIAFMLFYDRCPACGRYPQKSIDDSFRIPRQCGCGTRLRPIEGPPPAVPRRNVPSRIATLITVALCGLVVLGWKIAPLTFEGEPVEAVVVAANVDTIVKRSRRARWTEFQPELTYRYAVAGHTFETKWEPNSWRERARAEEWLARHPVGATRIVRYDPDQPSTSRFEPRERKLGWLLYAAIAFLLFPIVRDRG